MSAVDEDHSIPVSRVYAGWSKAELVPGRFTGELCRLCHFTAAHVKRVLLFKIQVHNHCVMLSFVKKSVILYSLLLKSY